jgi:glutamate-1-semialdehyde 2,1-aminomutase
MNTNSNQYKDKLHALIPGGAHTYSRGDDQFPYNAPAILERGKGAYVWSPEGNKYLDYGMGLRSVNIGYGNEEIAEAVYKESLKGNNLTRASVTELEAASLFVDIIPSVDMVKFAKHGSVVTTAAYKLARAYTDRKYIAIPHEQPFFSYDDWFIGSTVIDRGIPLEFSQLTLKFNYNDLTSLEKLFDEYPNQIAAVMLEPATTLSPCLTTCSKSQQHQCLNCVNNGENFLHKVRNLAHKNGSLFILDEMITGFRWHLNGAQSLFNIEPDLTTFGKAMANGFAVAALGGKRDIMSLGGIENEGAERIFLTSTTHGAEMSALGAFIKTVEILKRDNVIDHYWAYGTALMNGLNELAKQKGLQDFFYLEGYPCSPNYVTKDKEKKPSLAFRTLFAEQMLNSNILMPYIALSAAHGDKELDMTLVAAEKALEIYSQALENGIDKYLNSRVIKPVFRKYN